jgi:hypothetical protein
VVALIGGQPRQTGRHRTSPQRQLDSAPPSWGQFRLSRHGYLGGWCFSRGGPAPIVAAPVEWVGDVGTQAVQVDLLRSTVTFCEGRVARDSVYGVLHRECFNLFPDEMFADLFTDVGRRSVLPMIVAVVMVLQRFEELSDREAAERFAFDARWKYAAGAWISTIRGSCTRCWWTCARGCFTRSDRTGFSRRCCRWPGRRVGGPAAGGGFDPAV